jgi:hypothetical protein
MVRCWDRILTRIVAGREEGNQAEPQRSCQPVSHPPSDGTSRGGQNFWGVSISRSGRMRLRRLHRIHCMESPCGYTELTASTGPPTFLPRNFDQECEPRNKATATMRVWLVANHVLGHEANQIRCKAHLNSDLHCMPHQGFDPIDQSVPSTLRHLQCRAQNRSEVGPCPPSLPTHEPAAPSLHCHCCHPLICGFDSLDHANGGLQSAANQSEVTHIHPATHDLSDRPPPGATLELGTEPDR